MPDVANDHVDENGNPLETNLEQAPEILGLTDEEFLKLGDVPKPEKVEPVAEKIETDPSKTEVVDDTTVLGQSDQEVTNQDLLDSADETPDPKEKTTPSDKPAEETPEQIAADEEVKAKADQDKQDDEKADPAKDSEAAEQLALLFAPFKANGTEIKVDSVPDAINLMRMGANYHKKMEGLKPSLKIMKLLDNNGLLSEDHVNYLIDLHSKKPDAIAKLVRDAEIDPATIGEGADENYIPETRTVTDEELALDDALAAIRGTDGAAKTLNIVTEVWDTDSRNHIANQPHIIPIINEQVENGQFDKIMTVVKQGRMLGKLNGVSDYRAYLAVGDRLQAAGAFGEQPAPPVQVDQASPKVDTDAAAKAQAAKAKKKQAASLTRPAPQAKAASFNPLAMSDEEFAAATPKMYKEMQAIDLITQK